MSDLPVQPLVQSQTVDSTLTNISASDQTPTQTPADQTSTPTPTPATDAAAFTAMSQAAQTYDPLNPPNPVGGRTGHGVKEITNAGNLDTLVQEIPGAQAIDIEKSAEIPPEVESWMEKVEHHQVKAPEQVIIADETAQTPTGNYASQPVIVLPATQQAVQQGAKKSVTESIRWLAEWCIKMMKKFHGLVVYREIP